MFRQTEEELVADHERVRQLYELQVKMNFLWHEIDVLERSDEAHEGDGPALALTRRQRADLSKLKVRYEALEVQERALLRPGRLTDHPVIERRCA